MWTTTKIRQHIFNLAKGTPFTTRDLLSYGTRTAVDQSLYRLVKCGELIRLARGVFVRTCTSVPIPSAFEVATLKAKSFGKEIAKHGADLATEWGLIAEACQSLSFSVNGRSSSFRFGETVISLRGISQRKMALTTSTVRLMIRALWHVGQTGCTKSTVARVSSRLHRTDRQELRQSAALMPTWMASQFSCFQR